MESDDLNYGVESQAGMQASHLESMPPQRDEDIEHFKQLVLTLAIILAALGLLFNISFQLLIAFRVHRKWHRMSNTALIACSISIAYVVCLIFYTLKISVYSMGDNLSKFHMYDIVEDWPYAQITCQMVITAPVWAKLIARLSIFLCVLDRLCVWFNRRSCWMTRSSANFDKQDNIVSRILAYF
jgi:hypothetical protein